jgi:glycosyltransferase involved in cell wall biosynthesis
MVLRRQAGTRRLLYYLDAVGYGGAVKYVERLVKRIDPQEFAVTVVSPNSEPLLPLREALATLPVEWLELGDQSSRKHEVYEVGNRVRRRSGAGWTRVPGVRVLGKTALGVIGILEEARRLGSVGAKLREGRPDVLHVNLDRFPDTSGKLALLLGRESGACGVVGTLHCQPQQPVSPRFLHHYYDRRALRVVDSLIVVSRSQSQKLTRWYGAPERVVREIPNGAPAECFSRRDPLLERSALGFGATDVLVVHVGSILPLRGQVVLADALARLSSACARLRAAFVGQVLDQEYASRLDQILDAVPSRPYRRLGYRRDALEIMRSADIAVVSSFEEGHSLTLLEAMALGKAIVATDIESNSASLGGGEAGLLVPPGDTDALALALRRLHDDERLRRRLGEAAARRAADLYTEDKMFEATLGVYRSLGELNS